LLTSIVPSAFTAAWAGGSTPISSSVTRFEASSHDRIVHRCEQCNVTIELANSGDEKKPGQM
jgi:hypothetical protein